MAATKWPVEVASELMHEFADRTGLTSGRPKVRYLWTDAFAVFNFLGLANATAEPRWLDLAVRLVDQVHHELGRHRADDPREGWISGLDEDAGEDHPTRGGLRIGKRLPERRSNEVLDEELEWDRDGQYFHYLTKWMRALDHTARATGRARYNLWARELGAVAHDAFTGASGERLGRHIAWKMSIDLSRPLVPAMGQHDPIDGFLTCVELDSTAALLPSTPRGPSLGSAASDYASMLKLNGLVTEDPLGLGGLLTDAHRALALERCGALADAGLSEILVAASTRGLERYARHRDPTEPASRRLAFRELGLAIGLAAVDRDSLRSLAPYLALADEITSFWLDETNRRARTWTEHRDINEVMLATSLHPGGFLATGELDLRPPVRTSRA